MELGIRSLRNPDCLAVKFHRTLHSIYFYSSAYSHSPSESPPQSADISEKWRVCGASCTFQFYFTHLVRTYISYYTHVKREIGAGDQLINGLLFCDPTLLFPVWCYSSLTLLYVSLLGPKQHLQRGIYNAIFLKQVFSEINPSSDIDMLYSSDIIVILLSLLVVYAWKKERKKRASPLNHLPLPPSPSGSFPLVGHMLQIPAKFEWETYHRWCQELSTFITEVHPVRNCMR